MLVRGERVLFVAEEFIDGPERLVHAAFLGVLLVFLVNGERIHQVRKTGVVVVRLVVDAADVKLRVGDAQFIAFLGEVADGLCRGSHRKLVFAHNHVIERDVIEAFADEVGVVHRPGFRQRLVGLVKAGAHVADPAFVGGVERGKNLGSWIGG